MKNSCVLWGESHPQERAAVQGCGGVVWQDVDVFRRVLQCWLLWEFEEPVWVRRGTHQRQRVSCIFTALSTGGVPVWFVLIAQNCVLEQNFRKVTISQFSLQTFCFVLEDRYYCIQQSSTVTFFLFVASSNHIIGRMGYMPFLKCPAAIGSGSGMFLQVQL